MELRTQDYETTDCETEHERVQVTKPTPAATPASSGPPPSRAKQRCCSKSKLGGSEESDRDQASGEDSETVRDGEEPEGSTSGSELDLTDQNSVQALKLASAAEKKKRQGSTKAPELPSLSRSTGAGGSVKRSAQQEDPEKKGGKAKKGPVAGRGRRGTSFSAAVAAAAAAAAEEASKKDELRRAAEELLLQTVGSLHAKKPKAKKRGKKRSKSSSGNSKPKKARGGKRGKRGKREDTDESDESETSESESGSSSEEDPTAFQTPAERKAYKLRLRKEIEQDVYAGVRTDFNRILSKKYNK